VPEEPPAGPDVAEVVFRPPGGSGKKLSRRFMKTDSIKVLYDYIRTLDVADVGFDDRNANFQLIQPMPRKVFEESDTVTLQQAGLFPRAIVQIKEITE
jgi:hypothetical protein